MFSECNSNTAGRDIADISGDVRIQYGAVSLPRGRKKLAFGHPSVVHHPAKDARFDV